MLRFTNGRLAAYGFIGLGQMGGRMAPNLFKSSDVTELHLFDTNAESVQAIVDAHPGKAFSKTPEEIAKNCKTIVTMLPNGKIVRDVYATLLANCEAGTRFLDSSTVDPQTNKDLAAAAAAKDCWLNDAPVSGGINAAAAGTLTFIVGAKDEEDFAKAKAVLDHMGKNVRHCGGIGAGQVVKLCNNLILGQHMVAVSEAMLMGTRLGVDAKTLADVINTSTGRCWSSELYNPYPGLVPNIPAANDYEGGFGASLMLKDLGLAIDAAKSCGLTPEGGLNAHKVYTDMCNNDVLAKKDFSGVLKHMDGKIV